MRNICDSSSDCGVRYGLLVNLFFTCVLWFWFCHAFTIGELLFFIVWYKFGGYVVLSYNAEDY